MDITQFFSPLFSYAKYFIPIAILLALLTSAWFKGKLGEFAVNTLLKRHLNQDTYSLFKNLTIPTNDGTTQIDHLLISKFGIFVIETKNYKGWIFGSEKQKTWTQKIYKKNYKFQNPLHQNYKHIKSLAQLLSLSEDSFISIIIFSKDAIFKTSVPSNVTYGRRAIEYIRLQQTERLTQQDLTNIRKTLENSRLKEGLITDIKHVQHLRRKNLTEENHTKCPKCGSELVIRTARKGNNPNKQFWGCSSFPRCRFTQSKTD